MMKLSLLEVNLKAVELVKNIKILDNISWPRNVEKEFLPQIIAGKKPTITFEYPKKRFDEQRNELQKLLFCLSKENPLHVFTAKTIKSYITAIDMIHAVGEKRFQDLSAREYGLPTHKLFGSEFSHLETAKNILKSYHEFDHPYISDTKEEFSSSQIKKYIKKESKKIFGDYNPEFVLSEKMTAKASAGKSKVKFRKSATFSKYDFDQLLIHEVMTHTLTGINGTRQETLKLMGQGAPRTTKTQEGLATFAEVITGNMDLFRLKRLSLRVMALELAVEGADFYDLYDFFRKNEQSEKESFLSTTRILRGGYANGGIVFTKDGTYLEGLIRTHSFFRWAFRTHNLDLTHMLFCGRLDINDIFLLRGSYKAGEITQPVFLPNWYKDIDLLAGKMAFSILLNGIDLKNVDRHYSGKILKAS